MGDDTADAPTTIGRERSRSARQDLHRRRLQRPGGPRFGRGLRCGDQPVDQHPLDDQSAFRGLPRRLSRQSLRSRRIQRCREIEFRLVAFFSQCPNYAKTSTIAPDISRDDSREINSFPTNNSDYQQLQ